MFYLNLLLSCHGHHSSLNSLNMSLKKDHLTILNPASVSGIDYVRVLPPPSARIQVHLRVIHSNTTILCQYLIVHVWIERGGVAQSLLSTKTMPWMVKALFCSLVILGLFKFENFFFDTPILKNVLPDSLIRVQTTLQHTGNLWNDEPLTELNIAWKIFWYLYFTNINFHPSPQN